MMNRFKTVISLTTFVALGLIGTVLPVCDAADSTDTDIALRREAPIYSGPVQEEDLAPMTAEDFSMFGTESDSPEEQYRGYLKILDHPEGGTRLPYRMRIVDRDLTLDDFYGFDVPEDLAEARYDGYLSMEPDTEDGHTIHYVFVYYRPLDLKR